ncbi:uncharacterized protein K460DRAFT_358642 [Cucurbitaria berberidis CBS 394.84]|uniref:Uncharacterized protein n=1 Tax=Cucurbitaria berberidis CBS 394.84 TaxID=1168544 RepID=A0A9P4L4W6_9PLEO|nr:uncharacterized protein K460DRAFT_358642 [Cucurbitaria berberidis CBS 394.84]KAF1841955.1 hypothetical protein K460DRAFT_358642 [Cucurbitaria berberidis CBS 394.84]
MWKRLQGHGREKERHAQIGNPVLLETTYDEDQLRRNPNVTDVQNANFQRNAPARPQPQYTLSTLPPPDYRASEVPSASSVYSRPSHDLAYYNDNPEETSASAYEDISPPSSPEPDQYLSSSSGQPRRFRSMRDVSPMDENRKKLEGSNIPVLRRAPPALQTGDLQSEPKQKFWGGKVVPNSKVRWDDYSGEPTSSNGGKAASVTPGSYANGTTSSDPRPMGYQVSISGPGKRNVSLPERMSRFGTRPTPGPVERARPSEPWSRVTGRSEIAPPLKDDSSKKPLQLPRKQMSTTMERSGRDASGALAADTAPVTDETRDLDMHNDLIKPVVPLKVGKNSPPRSGLTSPTSPTNLGLGIHTTSYPSPITPTNQNHDHLRGPATAVDRQTAANLHPTQRSATPPYNAVKSKSPEETPEKDSQATASRFSWTTYNSATTYQHSPPPSPPPPLPSTLSTPVPKQRVVTEPISAAPSILNRRRPVPASDRFPEPITSRKPVPSTTESPGTAKIHTMQSNSGSPDPPSPSAASTFSTATTGTFKALPQPPTTLSASDHVSLLESQIEDLRIRRSNVYRLLNDLNNAAPANPLITDFKRARLVEQRKRGFEDELSEIKREEHDVGLKLHRAWKKREREDPNTGSALWVRRVTS